VSQNAFAGLALVGWFALLATVELLWRPRDQACESNIDSRLVTNFGLAALILSAGALFPLASLGSSVFAEQLDVGIARHIAMPWVALFALTIIVDSFIAYWAHRLMHATPLFWRVHRVHHADRQVDVSTSLRNHPLELLVTLPASAVAVLITGAPVSIIVAMQTLLTGTAIWQHADFALPQRLDRALSLVIVTQRVHRLHHAPDRVTHDSNYGELLIIWDRLFGTYNPADKREPVGLENQVASPDRLLQQIWSPVHAA
jgi:sterol desaturase/sphingolipid hydroxylase (fatty acid hydroxylase superfamily)